MGQPHHYCTANCSSLQPCAKWQEFRAGPAARTELEFRTVPARLGSRNVTCPAMLTSGWRADRHSGTIFVGVVVVGVVEVVHLDGVGCVLTWSLLLVLDRWSNFLDLNLCQLNRGHWICPQNGRR